MIISDFYICGWVYYHGDIQTQARSQVWIWGGGAFFKAVDFFACFFRESGLFRVLTACGACSLGKF